MSIFKIKKDPPLLEEEVRAIRKRDQDYLNYKKQEIAVTRKVLEKYTDLELLHLLALYSHKDVVFFKGVPSRVPEVAYTLLEERHPINIE